MSADRPGPASDGDDPFRHADAAYVLGALEPAERAAFEQHLAGCPQCRERVAELQELPALLAGLDESVLLDADPPDAGPVPDTLLPGLLRRAAGVRRRRRLTTAGLALVAAACAIALLVVGLSGPDHPNRPARTAMTALVPSPVTATASLESVAWGTRITLDCYYSGQGAPPAGLDYELAVFDRAGVAHDAGSWQLIAGQDVEFPAGTSLAEADISKIQIQVNGHAILQLTT